MSEYFVKHPILVVALNEERFDKFISQAGFKRTEVKWVQSIEQVRGYKDNILLSVDYVPDNDEIYEYAKSHNIEVVLAP